MSHNNTRNKPEEPNTAPQPDRWYNLNLGSSFQDNNNSSSKFYSLRYEFKPASIDKTQTGSLHKSKENRVTVEFQNNQIGKPKLSFDGSSEDYKDNNDAVLFFDGETFRLERLHRAVKRLRHNRPHGESVVGMGGTSTCSGMDARSPPPPSGRDARGIKAVVNAVPVEMERIDIGEPRSPVLKQPGKGFTETAPAPQPIASADSMDSKSHEIDEHLSMLFDDVESAETPSNKVDITEQEDVNTTNHNLDDEITVDLSDDETGNGPNAAEALRAQVNAKGSEGSSSSSSSSGSGSSGSGSGSGSSSSSDSEASDDNSVNSI